MIHRSITFDGVDLVEDLGLVYSNFSETLPKRKVGVVSIPYGSDIDYTETMGMNNYSNGTHVLVFMVYGDTEAERLRKKQSAIGILNGQKASYKLSWEPEYTYTGRCSVAVNHLSENVDVLTVTIDREPFKVGDEVSLEPTGVTMFPKPTTGTYYGYTYDISGADTSDVYITHIWDASVFLNGESIATFTASGTAVTDVIQGVRGRELVIVPSIIWYLEDGTRYYRKFHDYRSEPVYNIPDSHGYIALVGNDFQTASWGLDGHNVVTVEPAVTVRNRSL